MLIQFRVENHRSLATEQLLSLEAANLGDPADPRPRSVPGHPHRLLPAAAIYGANASGKTNVLDALAFMRNYIARWLPMDGPEEGIPRTPFAWGPQRDEPSVYELSVLLKGTRYRYGFAISDTEVLEEWLSASPPESSRERMWFVRETGSFRFGKSFEGERQALARITRGDHLFLTTAAQFESGPLRPLVNWLAGIRPINMPSSKRDFWDDPFKWADLGSVVNKLAGDAASSRLRSDFLRLLRSADLGIDDARVVEPDDGRPKNLRPRFELKHEGHPDAWLPLEQESKGTRALFSMGLSIAHALSHGRLLIIDELESSLHPMLACEILKLFNDPASNQRNAQLIFATHDTNLLGNLLGEPLLRRDQVWFTEKDREGQTHLYPLTDYQPRQAENLERGYLQGRYGAIPFLGSLAAVTE